ncbi:MAG: hypothetical protein LBN29_07380 [Mediterranea sp.]|jgi:hypothetical protein|nr:hypothetical protein [Mediterranea sp.]
MIHWQEWVVGALVTLCVARIVYEAYLFFRRAGEKRNPCDSCASGCALKDIMAEKQHECAQHGTKRKKNCCG